MSESLGLFQNENVLLNPIFKSTLRQNLKVSTLASENVPFFLPEGIIHDHEIGKSFSSVSQPLCQYSLFKFL